MSPALPPYAYTGRKLGTAVLGYVLAIIAVITLEPFAFARPSLAHVWWFDNWFDVLANVALFVPAGFLFALTRSATDTAPTAPTAARRTLRDATIVGALASSAIEVTQLFEPARYPSLTDVATNALGAALGALLFRLARRRFGADGPIVGQLALELPLMGLVYLLVPLCSLAALTVRGGIAPRGGELVALALVGGTLLGHVQRRHFGPTRTLTPRQTALVAALWFAVGAIPAVATAPPVFAIGVLAAGGVAWAYGIAPEQVVPINRRVESSALARATPWLVAYLLLVALTESPAPPVPPSSLDILHRVASYAGFTVVGYVLAEAWGRRELRYRHTAWRIALVAIMAALVSDALRTITLPTVASARSVLVHVLAAGYGGWMYHLQRAHVLALIAARRDAQERRGTQRIDSVRRITVAGIS